MDRYDVTVDDSAMDWEKAGPLFERYVVTLVGRVDRRWVDAYTQAVKATPPLSRFRLDAASSSVSFTCRTTDGPVEVMGVLERLKETIGKVNHEANLAIERAAAEARGDSEPAKPSLSSVAGGFLARFAKHTGPPAGDSKSGSKSGG